MAKQPTLSPQQAAICATMEYGPKLRSHIRDEAKDRLVTLRSIPTQIQELIKKGYVTAEGEGKDTKYSLEFAGKKALRNTRKAIAPSE